MPNDTETPASRGRWTEILDAAISLDGAIALLRFLYHLIFH